MGIDSQDKTFSWEVGLLCEKRKNGREFLYKELYHNKTISSFQILELVPQWDLQERFLCCWVLEKVVVDYFKVILGSQ